ncbi:MAG: class I SAM-dependent methyltransferase [Planctomycetota bacterium]
MIGKTFRSVRERGDLPTLALVRKNVMYQLRNWADRRFDRRYGLDTGGQTNLDKLTVEGENRDHGVYYEATPCSTFQRMMRAVQGPLHDFTFVDYGCGKGRVLLLATAYGFKKVIGVEFSPELCAVARKNAETFSKATGRAHPVEVACMDAVKFDIPAGPCVLYFYNPFDRELMGRIAEKIRASYESAPRHLKVVYYNTQSADAFERLGFLVPRARGTSRLDFAAAIKRPYTIYETRER